VKPTRRIGYHRQECKSESQRVSKYITDISNAVQTHPAAIHAAAVPNKPNMA